MGVLHQIAAAASAILAAAVATPSNMATTYSPMHSLDYPITGTLNAGALQASINTDLQLIAQSFTHVRTYYSQFYGISVAQYAAQHGLKLHLGVYMTPESWMADEINHAVAAVQNYPGTVEAILVGNENLIAGYSASDILGIVATIKARLGASASTVKFGTVQRVTEYLDSGYDSQTYALSSSLDLLGVNIYPFFDPGYSSSQPVAILDGAWRAVAAKFPASKLVLTETGYPTAGGASSIAPNVAGSLSESINYYAAVKSWVPPGNPCALKFWFDFFDRRPDDNGIPGEFEKYFGLFTYLRAAKSSSFALSRETEACSSCSTIGSYCGSQSSGAQCCVSGAYCQPWNANYYQCVAAPAKCGAPEVNVDYYGNDLKTVYGILPADCCSTCADTDGCAAYTFVNSNADGLSACYLKSGTGTKQTLLGAVSATVTTPKSACSTAVGGSCGSSQGSTCCPTGAYCQPWNSGYYQCLTTPSQCSTQLTDVDFYGNDLGETVFGVQPADCCAICRSTTGCKGYTFVNDNPGQTACYLKSSLSGQRATVGAVSGIVN